VRKVGTCITSTTLSNVAMPAHRFQVERLPENSRVQPFKGDE